MDWKAGPGEHRPEPWPDVNQESAESICHRHNPVIMENGEPWCKNCGRELCFNTALDRFVIKGGIFS